MNKHLIFALLSCFIFGSCLTPSGWFVVSELTAVFLLVIFASLLVLIGSSVAFVKPTVAPVENGISASALLISVFGCYVLLHGLWIGGRLQLIHYYLMAGCLFAGSCRLWSRFQPRAKLLWLLYVLAFGQSVCCLLQLAGILLPNSAYFPITGTFSNPNISAMLIVLCVLPFPYLLNKVRKAKKMLWGSLLVIIWAVYLLHCRSAWLGLMLAAVRYVHTVFSLPLLFKRIFRGRGGTMPYHYTIDFNTAALDNASNEYITATLYHELLHALFTSQGVPGSAQHDLMANQWLGTISSQLRADYPGLSQSDADALAWGGLGETQKWKDMVKKDNDDNTSITNRIAEKNKKHKNLDNENNNSTGTHCPD